MEVLGNLARVIRVLGGLALGVSGVQGLRAFVFPKNPEPQS